MAYNWAGKKVVWKAGRPAGCSVGMKDGRMVGRMVDSKVEPTVARLGQMKVVLWVENLDGRSAC